MTHSQEVASSNLAVAILSNRINLYRKKVTIILLISKKLAHKLNKEYGVPFGEGGISTSKTKHKKYYLCERHKNMIALEKATK